MTSGQGPSRPAVAAGGPQQIIVIQYLRGLAAVLVVIYHTTMMTAVAPLFPLHIGKFGVDIFFVVSGFVMWTTTAGQPRRPLSFWTARVVRIVPLYWIFTTVFLVALVLVPGAAINARVLDWDHILKSYLLIPAIDPGIGGISPIYSIGWTLQFEMFFYAVFGLCLLIRSTAWRGATLLIVFAALVVAGLAVRPSDPILATYTHPLLLEFLAGVVIAMAQRRLMRVGPNVGAAIMGGGVALIATSFALPAAVELVAAGAGCVLLVAGALAFERAARERPIHFFKLIGDASYSMYLAHPICQRAAFTALQPFFKSGLQTPLDLVIYAIVAIAAGVGGGIASYFLIERPIIRRLKPRPLRSRPIRAETRTA